MPNILSPNFEPRDGPETYFTSKDMNEFESALNDAMSDLEQSGLIGDDGDARNACRLRLAASIMRQASGGERDPDMLRRSAIRCFFASVVGLPDKGFRGRLARSTP